MTACVHCHTPLPIGFRYCPTCGADSSDPGTIPRPRQPVGDLHARLKAVVGERYEVRRLLGRGGMGAVFLAVDRKLERDVAIKVLPPDLAHDEDFVRRFEHEARTAAKLDHTGIIPIYAVESDEELHYFVMKYVPGRTLDDVLTGGQVPIDLAQRILWESACALGHAHQRDVVHRDIKPANIMIDDNGRALLTDFGISKALQSTSQFTAAGQVVGTPHYMSPEQARGEEVSGASDQYSLAVVGYRLLTGRLPFQDDAVHTVIYKHVFEIPPPLQTLRRDAPGFLSAAIHRSLQKDPDDRFGTMEEFASAVWPENPVTPASRDSLQSHASGRVVASVDGPTEISQPTGRVTAATPRKSRRSRMLAAALVVLLGTGAVVVSQTETGRLALGRLMGQGGEPGTGASASTPQPQPPVPIPVQPDSAVSDTAAAEPEVSPPVSDPEPPPAERPSRPVQRTAPPRPEIAPVRVGYLTIDATPSGLLVVDGQEIGDTPVFKLELSIGPHDIEIRREGYQTYRERIEISAGNDRRKRITLVPEGA